MTHDPVGRYRPAHAKMSHEGDERLHLHFGEGIRARLCVHQLDADREVIDAAAAAEEAGPGVEGTVGFAHALHDLTFLADDVVCGHSACGVQEPSCDNLGLADAGRLGIVEHDGVDDRPLRPSVGVRRHPEDSSRKFGLGLLRPGWQGCGLQHHTPHRHSQSADDGPAHSVASHHAALPSRNSTRTGPRGAVVIRMLNLTSPCRLGRNRGLQAVAILACTLSALAPRIAIAGPARPDPILLDRLILADEGEAVRIAAMAARIPLDTMAVLLAAGAPALEDVRITPEGGNGLRLRARAFGLPVEVGCGLGAEAGRLVLTLDAVRLAMLPVGGPWMRDRIVQAADPDLFRRDLWRKRGANGLSINPSYLIGWALAGRKTPSGRRVEGNPLRVDLGALTLQRDCISIKVP